MSRHSGVATVLVSLVVLGATCKSDLTAPELVGEWGGEHIQLTLTDSGATLEYDCAHGSISEMVDPDKDGNFDVGGVHILEHGGPIQEGELPDEHPARYSGWTDGRRMRLTVVLVDSGNSVGTFDLALGGSPRLFKCL